MEILSDELLLLVSSASIIGNFADDEMRLQPSLPSSY
jgi:hypothetical protein